MNFFFIWTKYEKYINDQNWVLCKGQRICRIVPTYLWLPTYQMAIYKYISIYKYIIYPMGFTIMTKI
jgi:hypothetical protein